MKISGEISIELRNSWFTVKTIEVVLLSSNLPSLASDICSQKGVKFSGRKSDGW